MDNLRENIAIRLIEERGRLGYTKANLAHQAEISGEMLRRYELGLSGIPAEFLAVISGLGFDLQYILTGVRSKNTGEVEKAHNVFIGDISGNNISGIVGGVVSNVTQTNVTTERYITQKKVEVIPGENAIDAKQKGTLLQKVNEIVEWEKNTRQQPKTHKAVWSALNRHCGVNTYKEIAIEDFDKAVTYLDRWRGRLLNTKKAQTKSNKAWRSNRIKAIHVKIKEKNIETWYRDFLKTKFGVSSSTELDDEQLQSLYLSVTRKKTEGTNNGVA